MRASTARPKASPAGRARPSPHARKLAGKDRPKPKSNLRTINKYFWYIDDDGETRLVSTSTSGICPERIDTYHLNPGHFVEEPYPDAFPPGFPWPPKRFEDIIGADAAPPLYCVGDEPYTSQLCRDSACSHTFEQWAKAAADCQKDFELRKTPDRGFGVWTKRGFNKGDVLGWYAGEVITADQVADGDYLMEMDFGLLGTQTERHSFCVFIDAGRKGNWARFINHSCDPYTVFGMRRAGNLVVMAVEARRDIPADVELTVHYGDQYYSKVTGRICNCKSKKCVTRKRKERRKSDGEWRPKKKSKKR